MTTTLFIMNRDINGANSFILPDSNTKYQTILAAGVAQSCTAPNDYQLYRVIFSFNGAPIWVSINGIAEVPGSSFTATTSSLSKVGLEVTAGTVLSFITNQVSAEIGVEFYAIQ